MLLEMRLADVKEVNKTKQQLEEQWGDVKPKPKSQLIQEIGWNQKHTKEEEVNKLGLLTEDWLKSEPKQGRSSQQIGIIYRLVEIRSKTRKKKSANWDYLQFGWNQKHNKEEVVSKLGLLTEDCLKFEAKQGRSSQQIGIIYRLV